MSQINELFLDILKYEVKMLPDQAPLEHFVHHNNLHHFEDLPFENAVESGFLKYGRSAYMPLSYYRKKLSQGHISSKAFNEALIENDFEFDETLVDYIQNYLYEIQDDQQISFYHKEKMRWNCQKSKWIKMDNKQLKLWKSLLEIHYPVDEILSPDFHANRSINKTSLTLIPFLAAMLDQGQAQFQLSIQQRKNPWSSFLSYIATVIDKNKLNRFMQNIPSSQNDVDVQLASYLKNLKQHSIQSKIKEELNILPGWAGMINKCENNKEVIPRKDVYLTLKDYLLMRLILNDIYEIKNQVEYRPIQSYLSIKENIFNYLCINPKNEVSVEQLFKIFAKLNSLVLKRIFQQAYEQTYQNKILYGLSNKKIESNQKIDPSFQMFFCIDDREASFRRYLEEVSKNKISTFGVAGFFGLDMMYQEVGQPRARRLCPPAATPKFLVTEEGVNFKFKFARFFHYEHSSFLRSAFSGLLFAPWKTFLFKLHLYLPRIKRQVSKNFKFSKVEKIQYLDQEKDINQLHCGYSIEQLALRVATILKGAGLVKNFAPYIMMIGHGHDSFNNPHVSAYRCGACSGANAYPNAKIFSFAANNPKVREILIKKHNINIPPTCYFVGGYHDTCNDQLELYNIDQQRLPENIQKELNQYLLEARQLNAKERCHKFYQAPNNLSPKKALKFVEDRAWSISEPRPELNHATNSLCIVGKRELSENLFLDRRAFLVSYDYQIDENSQILNSLLSAVIPVCAGINLEYYFSKVDTENYGSGSKTSHNVTGLFGVMNGIRGDLRTGLVWQMVEYHDPLRILFVIEAYESQLEKIIQENIELSYFIKNHWIQLALIHPENKHKVVRYQKGKFVQACLEELKINEYQQSQDVPTGIKHPVDIAYIKGLKHG